MAQQGNYFSALDGIIVDMSALNKRLDKKAKPKPSSPATHKNKQQQQQKQQQSVAAAKNEQTKKKVVKKQQPPTPDPEMMRAKPLILPEEFLQRQLVLRRPPPKPQGEGQPANGGVNGNNGFIAQENLVAQENSEVEPKKVEEPSKKLTLEEYEKEVLEKRKKALEGTMKSTEQRIVNLGKDFESMKLVNKKKQEDKVEKDKKGKKKYSNGLRKSMCIDEVLKPVDGDRPFTAARRHAKFVDKLMEQQGQRPGEKKDDLDLSFDDPCQFPGLMAGAVRAYNCVSYTS